MAGPPACSGRHGQRGARTSQSLACTTRQCPCFAQLWALPSPSPAHPQRTWAVPQRRALGIAERLRTARQASVVHAMQRCADVPAARAGNVGYPMWEGDVLARAAFTRLRPCTAKKHEGLATEPVGGGNAVPAALTRK